MALIEEVVWRGYRLRIVAKNKKEMVAILFVSLEWAVWHIPMWTMRNLIGIGEIAFWILYTVIVGCVLGKSFMRYRNILVPIFLHDVFDVNNRIIFIFINNFVYCLNQNFIIIFKVCSMIFPNTYILHINYQQCFFHFYSLQQIQK